jgi:hypothetical protein
MKKWIRDEVRIVPDFFLPAFLLFFTVTLFAQDLSLYQEREV